MIPVHGFTVIPRIPDQLQGLFRIAMNLWWCWDPEAIDVFRHLDRMLWERCYANPIRMLGLVSQERLAELATDEGYLAMLDRVGARALQLPGAADVVRADPRKERPSGGLLLRGVRHRRGGPALFGRPRHPGGRPPQVGQRPGHPPGGGGAALPPGVFPPVPERRRLAAGAVSGGRLPCAPAVAGATAGRQPGDRLGGVPRPDRAGRRCGGRRSAASRSTSWTRTWRPTGPRTAR